MLKTQNTEIQEEMGCRVIRFPVQERMPTRIAEEKVGSIVLFRFPPEVASINEWAKTWFVDKFVLIGWSSLNQGLLSGFRDGRAKHKVESVRIRRGRPFVEVACLLQEFPVWNWEAKKREIFPPAILLSESQQRYFRVCQRCENGQSIVSSCLPG